MKRFVLLSFKSSLLVSVISLLHVGSLSGSRLVKRDVDFGANCFNTQQQYDLCNDDRGYCDYPGNGNGQGRLKCFKGLACGAFPEVDRGSFVLTDPQDNVLGATAKLTCCSGYHADGATTIMCGVYSKWSTASGTCEANDCESTPLVDNGSYNTPFGTTYPGFGYLTCDPGFVVTYTSFDDTFIRCHEDGSWISGSATCKPAAGDCTDLQAQGATTSGVYTVTINGKEVDVLCEMEGGSMWTVIQQRESGAVSFYRKWETYQKGFGELNGNFWFGLDNIYHIVGTGTQYRVKFDITDSEKGAKTATYESFSIADNDDNYRLAISGYSGDAGEAMIARHNGQQFSTFDRDNDLWSQNNCADRYTGAWWHNACHTANLNAEYGNDAYSEGINWYPLTTYDKSATYTRIKVQPVNP